MQSFQYHGFDSSGAKVDGEVEASSLLDARQQLKRQGILVKSLKPEVASGQDIFSSNRVSLADIEFLTAELSLLLDAGLKIDKGIELLKRTSKKPGLRRLLTKLSQSLRSGKQLSEALAESSDIFDGLYINLVSIGEATGNLSVIFRQLAEDLSFRRDLQQKITQALTYPMVILAVCLMSIVFIFNFVVPNMSGLFSEHMELPWYTSSLLNVSDWFIQYQWYLLIAIAVATALMVSAGKASVAKQRMNALAFKLPLFHGGIVLVERIRFNSGLSMMLQAGVAVDQALWYSMGNIRNKTVQREIGIAIEKIKRGEPLAQSLKQSCLYPDFFASLLAVGEESGELTKIFREIAMRSQRDFSQWVTRMTSLLEPLLILLMGAIVGGVVVVMMLSITTVTDLSF